MDREGKGPKSVWRSFLWNGTPKTGWDERTEEISMKEEKKRKLGARGWSILLSLCEAAVGVLLLIKPVEFSNGVLTLLGIVCCVMGLLSAVRYFRTPPVEAALQRGLASGLLCLALGVFFLTKKAWLLGAFPLLTVLYGVLMLIAGIGKVQWAVDMLRLKRRRWYWLAISAALTLLFALVVLMNPFSSTVVLWTCTAVFLIVDALFDLVALLFSRETTEC